MITMVTRKRKKERYFGHFSLNNTSSPPSPFLLTRYVQPLDFSLYWPGNAGYMLLIININKQITQAQWKHSRPISWKHDTSVSRPPALTLTVVELGHRGFTTRKLLIASKVVYTDQHTKHFMNGTSISNLISPHLCIEQRQTYTMAYCGAGIPTL